MEFPLVNKERLGSTVYCDLVHRFLDFGRKAFSRQQVHDVAKCGDKLVNRNMPLHMELRDVQEKKMVDQCYVAEQAEQHSKGNPELRADILELHRLCAIPKFGAILPMCIACGPYLATSLRMSLSLCNSGVTRAMAKCLYFLRMVYKWNRAIFAHHQLRWENYQIVLYQPTGGSYGAAGKLT